MRSCSRSRGPTARNAQPTARRVTIETRRRDITRLAPHELGGAALITASALLDVMTGAELDRFVAICAGAGCPALVLLSVTGQVELEPPDPFDHRVREAFNAHQRRTVDGERLARPRRGRRRGGPLRASGRRGPGPAEPMAAWPGAAGTAGGMVHRMACGGVRADTGPGEPRPLPMRSAAWPRRPPVRSGSRCTTRTSSFGRDDAPEVERVGATAHLGRQVARVGVRRCTPWAPARSR